MAQKTKDELVRELLGVVEAKKAEIAKAEKPKWETNCSFSYNPRAGGEKINIQTVSDVTELVQIGAHIVLQNYGFDSASKSLGITAVFKWQGFTVDEWFSDLQTRINKIEISKKKSELADLEERLGKLISKEERERIELEQIQKQLLG